MRTIIIFLFALSTPTFAQEVKLFLGDIPLKSNEAITPDQYEMLRVIVVDEAEPTVMKNDLRWKAYLIKGTQRSKAFPGSGEVLPPELMASASPGDVVEVEIVYLARTDANGKWEEVKLDEGSRTLSATIK